VLVARGLSTEADPSDGALPSGRSLLADAALLLASLTADPAHRSIAVDALAPALGVAADQPSAFGAALAVASRLAAPLEQLVVLGPGLESAARGWRRGPRADVTPEQSREWAAAGFELFDSRTRPGAYFCESFVCALPVTTALELEALLTRS
jgi:uncharacterized protein YyaL (SSP411 family)